MRPKAPAPEKQPAAKRLLNWLKKEKFGILAILVAAGVFFGARMALREEKTEDALSASSADLAASPVLTDDMAVLTVNEADGAFSFTRGGKTLVCGEREDVLWFEDGKSENGKWNIIENADGTVTLLNVNAAIDGSSLGICCIGGFTAYAYVEGATSFKMEFWAVDGQGSLARLDRLPQNGDAVVLYFPSKKAVLSAAPRDTAKTGDYAEYEKGVVLEVTENDTWVDDVADGAYRGQQTLTVEVRTGQYKGRTLTDVYHYVGPLNSVPVDVGDGVALIISSYGDGSVRATVYEYDRIPALIAVVLLFFAVTALVGGKTGLKSLLGLAVTVLTLFTLLIPLLLKGWPTLPTTFGAAVFIAVISFTLLGGVRRKTVCAMLGAVAGTAFALGFGLLAQTLARVDGLRITDVEPLLQLRQTGTPVGLRGLLVAGVIISALGAVMDVAMSVSSALEEVHAANPALGVKALFRSGMNIGRDMVGTMTNTLILAFLGAGFTLIVYLWSLGLQPYQLYTSAWVAVELISGVAASVGMILSIPLTALVSALLLANDTPKEKK
ncbi:MAG: YibE/F family protein [Clostridia bacterium]|nr:YibE/F family protein [Clostridia bacterium]